MFNKSYMSLLAIIFPVFLLSGCKSKKNIYYESPSTYDQKMEGFVVTRVYKGKISMTLEGKSAVIDSRNIADVSCPIIKFYDKGNCVSSLTAENVKINMKTYDVKCGGKCVINTINSENLQTTNLVYNAKNNFVYSNNDVKFVKLRETVYGTGFESDIMLNNIVIKNQRIIID